MLQWAGDSLHLLSVELPTMTGPMRSPRATSAALILLLGVALAFVTAIAFGAGAENVIHLALAASFFLLAFAVFDFRLQTWINVAACRAGVQQ